MCPLFSAAHIQQQSQQLRMLFGIECYRYFFINMRICMSHTVCLCVTSTGHAVLTMYTLLFYVNAYRSMETTIAAQPSVQDASDSTSAQYMQHTTHIHIHTIDATAV
jgi:hypothetical protein